MTNKEHLATLHTRACAARLQWLMESCNDLIQWLTEEYTPVKPAGIAGLEFCPCCYHHLDKEDAVCPKCFTDIDLN